VERGEDALTELDLPDVHQDDVVADADPGAEARVGLDLGGDRPARRARRAAHAGTSDLAARTASTMR
jgi:hypothetical protein